MKGWLKKHSKNEDHGMWSHHFMPNRWGIMETVTDFIFLGSKITADGDCRHEIKRHLLCERKNMTTLGRVLKSREITLDGECSHEIKRHLLFGRKAMTVY